MEYVELGDTGESVSRLGFGGAPVGLPDYLGPYDPDDTADRDQVREALQTALECGITYFDTAPGYGDGASEEIFGEVLDGEEVFIATKVKLHDAGALRDSVEGSLERLRRDTVDLLQIHGGSYSSADVETILEGGVLSELQAIKDDGLVNHVGFTTEDNNPATYELIQAGVFDTMQINYNLLFQNPQNPINESGSLLEAVEKDVGTITMRTTTSGIFQNWHDAVRPEDDFEYAPALIQFVLSNPYVDVALVGMRDPHVVEENAALVDDHRGRIDLEEVFDRYHP